MEKKYSQLVVINWFDGEGMLFTFFSDNPITSQIVNEYLIDNEEFTPGNDDFFFIEEGMRKEVLL